MSYDTDADYLYTQEDIDKLEAELAEARKQIAAKDAALDALDEAHQITQQNLWQDITELRASLAGKEQEHQDFRLQNDAEWRAKLDHLKAQIAQLTKKANFNEGLRDVAMRDRGRMEAALTHIINECSRFPIKDGLAFRVESIALNALAAPAHGEIGTRE
jgi:chromosome segregation ATPase